MKRFLAIFVAIVICFTMTTTVFAVEYVTEDDGWVKAGELLAPRDGLNPQTIGGEEVWDKNVDYSETFTVYGNNLTPVKTIGRDGRICLFIAVTIQPSKMKLLVQVRKAGTQEVKAEWTLGPFDYYEHTLPYFSVTKGEKIQIYFKTLDANGNYNDNSAVRMQYGYYYENKLK